jgi:hypothetical protein
MYALENLAGTELTLSPGLIKHASNPGSAHAAFVFLPDPAAVIGFFVLEWL